MQLSTLTLLLIPIISATMVAKPNEDCSCTCKPAVNMNLGTVLPPITEESKRLAKETVDVPAKADFKPKIESPTPHVAQNPVVQSAPTPGTSMPENKTLASAIHSEQKMDLPKPAEHGSTQHNNPLHHNIGHIKNWQPRGTGELFGSRPHPTRTQSATVIAKVPIRKDAAMPVKAAGFAEISLADIAAIAKKVWAHPKEWYTILFGSNTAAYPKPINFEELAKTKTAQLEAMTSSSLTMPKPAANTVASQSAQATVVSSQPIANVVANQPAQATVTSPHPVTITVTSQAAQATVVPSKPVTITITSQAAQVTVVPPKPVANVVANQPAQATVTSPQPVTIMVNSQANQATAVPPKPITNVVPNPPTLPQVNAHKSNAVPNPPAQVHVESHSKPSSFAEMIQKRAKELRKVDTVAHSQTVHHDIKIGALRDIKEVNKLHHEPLHAVHAAPSKVDSHPLDSKMVKSATHHREPFMMDHEKSVDIHQLLHAKPVGTQSLEQNLYGKVNKVEAGVKPTAGEFKPLPESMHLDDHKQMAGEMKIFPQDTPKSPQHSILPKIGAGKDFFKPSAHRNLARIHVGDKVTKRFRTF